MAVPEKEMYWRKNLVAHLKGYHRKDVPSAKETCRHEIPD